MRRRSLLDGESGTAAVEMALLVPMLIVLLFGGFEAGHFVWTQHKLVEAVRDGARFASRLSISQLCDQDSVVMSEDTEGEIKLLTRTGQLTNTSTLSKVPGWTDAEVTVEIRCNAEQFVDTGIYSDLGFKGPIVRVSANGVTYPSLFNGLGIIPRISLSASSNAPVIGL
jgi:hypothetical protein